MKKKTTQTISEKFTQTPKVHTKDKKFQTNIEIKREREEDGCEEFKEKKRREDCEEEYVGRRGYRRREEWTGNSCVLLVCFKCVHGHYMYPVTFYTCMQSLFFLCNLQLYLFLTVRGLVNPLSYL